MKLTPTYQEGVVLAANAVGLGVTVVDCHDCFLTRSSSLSAGNDWGVPREELWAPELRRFRAPNLAPRRLVTGTADALCAEVRKCAADHPSGPILVCPSWMTKLLQSDLEGIAADLSDELGRMVKAVERMGIDDDWIDGIRAYQRAAMDLLATSEPPGDGAVVRGFCLFRREGDELGNVRELRRLWKAIGLPPARWVFVGDPEGDAHPSGSPEILFPIGTDASEPDAAASVRLQNLPIGRAATMDFLRSIAAPFEGTRTRVEELIEQELADLDRGLFPHVANVLAGRAAIVIGDPWTAAGLAGALRELGLDVSLLAALRRESAEDLDRAALESVATQVWLDPELEDLEEFIARQSELGLCDVIVGADATQDCAALRGIPFVEVGPLHRVQHFCAPTPYMGFQGLMHLADRLSNAIADSAYRRRVLRYFGPG